MARALNGNKHQTKHGGFTRAHNPDDVSAIKVKK